MTICKEVSVLETSEKSNFSIVYRLFLISLMVKPAKLPSFPGFPIFRVGALLLGSISAALSCPVYVPLHSSPPSGKEPWLLPQQRQVMEPRLLNLLLLLAGCQAPRLSIPVVSFSCFTSALVFFSKYRPGLFEWINPYPADKCWQKKLRHPLDTPIVIYSVDSVIHHLNIWSY